MEKDEAQEINSCIGKGSEAEAETKAEAEAGHLVLRKLVYMELPSSSFRSLSTDIELHCIHEHDACYYWIAVISIITYF